MKPIYLDYNATTPLSPAVFEAMIPFLRERFGNPSSSHSFGRAARLALEEARDRVAAFLGCRPKEVVFTSGGTESNNLALAGAARAREKKGGRIVVSAVEHPAVMEVGRALEKEGFDLEVLPVDGSGLVDPAALERAMTPETFIVSVMHANNEVGTVEPIAALARIARARGALFHTDAAQSAGKIPVKVGDLGVDLLSLAGHKLYAPKGVGALYIREGSVLEKVLHGADHEGGLRPGTENVAGIVGLGRACEEAAKSLEDREAHMRAMRDRLHDRLRAALGEGGAVLNGHREKRLPNTLSVAFPGLRAEILLAAIGDRVAASAGSACHSQGVSISPVLEAMGVPKDHALGTVRFSTGALTAAEEIDDAAAAVAAAVQTVRDGKGRGDGAGRRGEG